MPDCTCGHPKRSHNDATGDAHGESQHLTSCRRCSCHKYTEGDDG